MDNRQISRVVLHGLLIAAISFALDSLAAEPQRILESGLTPSDTTSWSAEHRVDQSDPKWASNVCGGHPTFAIPGARYEWTPVYSGNGQYGSIEPVSGWVLWKQESTTDVPFTHPFGGTDYTYLVRPDSQYVNLLAPRNFEGSIDPEHAQANAWGASAGISSEGGLLEIEQDRGLIPSQYRPVEGDRVVVFGRWIIDCGHDSWLSEIHPPLLTAVARASRRENGANVTRVSLVANPYLVSQEFPNGGVLDQLIHDVAEINWSPPLFPIIEHVSAEANFLPPTSGLQIAFLKIKAPTPAPSSDHRLYVRMHLTVRPGVLAQPFMVDSETLGVLVLFTDNLSFLPITGWHYWDVSAAKLLDLQHDAGIAYQGVISEAALAQFDFAKLVVLARGIRGILYDAPVEPDLSNAEVTQGWASQSPWGQDPVAVNDTQAFPLIGWIEVSWGKLTSPLQEVPPPRGLDRIIALRINELKQMDARNSTIATRMTAIGELISATSPLIGIDGAWRYRVLIGRDRVSESGQIWLKARGSKLQGIVESQGHKTALDGEISRDGTKVILNRRFGVGGESRVELTRSGNIYSGTLSGTRSRIELRRP